MALLINEKLEQQGFPYVICKLISNKNSKILSHEKAVMLTKTSLETIVLYLENENPDQSEKKD